MIVLTIVQPEFNDLDNFDFINDYEDTHNWLSQFDHYHARNTLKQLEIKYE